MLSSRWLVVATVVLLGGCFLYANRGVLNAPFGWSFQGENAGFFGIQVRSIEQNGFVTGRFGGRYALAGHGHPDATYADHPPLIYAEGYLSRLLGGHGNMATQAPAWLGSLAAIALLAWLLLDAGLSPPAVSVGLALGVGSSMFFVYGTMLDTFITSVPFGLAALLAAQRAAKRRPFPVPVAVLLGALAALAGWQALLIGGFGVVWIAGAHRREPHGWRAALPLAAGVAFGLALTVAWIWWVDGSLADLLNQGGNRAGSTPLGTWAHFQLHSLTKLFNPVVIAVSPVLFVVALWHRRTRALTIGLLLTVISYTIAFREGASIHEYWNYWLVLPLAVAGAATFDRLLSLARSINGISRRPIPRLVLAVMVAVALSCVVIPTGSDHSSSRRIADHAKEAPKLVKQAEALRGGPITIAVHDYATTHEAWIPYLTGTPAVKYQTDAQLASAARRNPHLLVFTPLPPTGKRRTQLITRALVANRHFALVPARVMPS